MYASNQASRNYYVDDACTSLTDVGETSTAWHVIWSRSNFEKIVMDELRAKGYEVFLPMARQWSVSRKARSAGDGPELKAQQLANGPLFKSYLFVQRRIDKASYLDISNTRGVVQILGVRWNRLATISDEYIASIRLLVDSQLPLLPYPYLKAGAQVRITSGPLANALGTLVRQNSENGLFVVSVSLLQKSVAVHVDCCDVEPA